MRLLTYDSGGKLDITRDLADSDVQPYAILSHTWGPDEEEVVLHEVGSTSSQTKAGYTKITFCGRQAQRDGWSHFWVDTCCIDKANHVELSKAITSMYRWYQEARVCYVYLADVSCRFNKPGIPADRGWESEFRQSRWFRRGWTLQELLAPRHVVFYSKEWEYLGTKAELKELLRDITGIPALALDGQPLSQFPVIERMRWTQGRQTKEKEDQAYCLLGIFGVFMPLIYGEGDHAFRRLQREIDIKLSGDGIANTDNDLSNMRNNVRPLGLCLASAPLIQSNEFVGRTAEISTIHDMLQSGNVRPEQQRVVLGGFGGVGKTQLAIAYARQHSQSYTSVLWLNASSEPTLYASLRSVARGWSAAGQVERLDNEQVLVYVHAWLSRVDNPRWLLIFDNHDDPDMFVLDQFYPNVGHGSVLVTTRLPDRLIGCQVRVQPLDQIEHSFHILATRSGRKEIQHDPGAYRLATRMEGLPLALVTAGAYLRQSTLSCRQYLEAYERRWQVDQRQTSPLQDYRDRTLFNTWDLSHDQLTRDHPEAAQMLKLLAYFDHQEIWYQLFEAGLPDHSLSGLHVVLADEVDFTSVMSVLVDYCFVEVQHTTRSYSIHSCVHDWMLGALNREVDVQLYWYAFDCVAASIDRSDWGVLGKIQYTRVSRHGLWLTHHRFNFCDKFGLSNRLNKAVWIAEILQEHIQLCAAEQMYERTLAGYEKALGPDHTSTLNTVNNLGVLYQRQDKLEQAEQMYKRALAGCEKALGPDHTSTLDTVNNLGVLYERQDKLEQAEQMYKRALAGYEKALGPDHTSTLNTVNNLSLLYERQGELAQANQNLVRVVIGRTKILGTDHPKTLKSERNLKRIREKIASGDDKVRHEQKSKNTSNPKKGRLRDLLRWRSSSNRHRG